jgi:hypothetical protein
VGATNTLLRYMSMMSKSMAGSRQQTKINLAIELTFNKTGR